MARGISMRAARLALVASLVALWLFANTEQSHACSCVPPGPPSEALAESAVVFAGKVTSVREFEDPDATTYSSTDPTTVEFKVDTVWKGPSYETMSLTTARSDASCGFTFIEGEEYVVYSRDGATVSLCSRTRSVAYAQEDFDELGEGDKPGPGSSRPGTGATAWPGGRLVGRRDRVVRAVAPCRPLPPRRVGGGPDGRPRLARSAPAASRVGGYAKPSASSM